MMLKPIFVENDQVIVHCFGPQDMDRFQKLTAEVFSILSDEHTLKFIPAKRLHGLSETELFLQTMIVNYHSGKNYLHFITDKKLEKVVGMIDLISPEVAKKYYQMDHYPFFIEFYLSSSASGYGIMTEILPMVVDNLLQQDIAKIGAVVNRENLAARQVLEKAGFSFQSAFDQLQDLYEILP